MYSPGYVLYIALYSSVGPIGEHVLRAEEAWRKKGKRGGWKIQQVLGPA